MTQSDLESEIQQLAKEAGKAAFELAALDEATKNKFLQSLAASLSEKSIQECLITENKKDLEAGEANGLSSSLLDRLAITPIRIDSMIEGIKQVAALKDPVGELLETRTHPKGFEISKIRVPIGVIGIIYESRPNVTIDCAILCFKSGNATILRGGKEAFHSNTFLISIIQDCLKKHDLPANAVQLIPTTNREALNHLLKLDDLIHCIIPRGGESLIRFVSENARMPVIKHYKGVCNIYIEESSDISMAVSIVINAKCQRPSVCNAAENLIFSKKSLNTHLLPIVNALVSEEVELRVDKTISELLKSAKVSHSLATDEDYHTEYVDKIISLATVNNLEEAINFVNTYGSKHSDAIVTENEANAKEFQTKVDSATVYWNVSTRFTDGFEFGLGAEIGISTDKLHARGPMGLTELTSYKYLIEGKGIIR